MYRNIIRNGLRLGIAELTFFSTLDDFNEVAKIEPQAAFNGFCSGFRHKLTYHMRVLPNLHEHLGILDATLDNFFIPAITGGHICSEEERHLLSLPFNKGEMSISILVGYVLDELLTNNLGIMMLFGC